MTKIKFSVLPKNQSAVSIGDTTKHEGRRNPYLRGIFLSKFYLSIGEQRLKSIEFAIRLISRNKPSNRTNKASHSCMVVETLSHPINRGDANHLLTKHETIKMLFKFILLGKRRLKLSIRANSEQQARNLLNLQSNALFIARINDKGGIYA